MFTGLIQSVGTINSFKRQGHAAQLGISSNLAAENLQLGESIAVNGACLTVVTWDKQSFK